ncbi:MAG: GNAT family N-acetyltransferase [Anaerolineae bacterium]|nr:GNAT family N-acetyltransferase [Anaerolineae bacterium]
MSLAPLSTERLLIREFTLADSEARRLLTEEAFGSAVSPEQNDLWLRWTVLNYGELAKLYQPPYGDYAITLKDTGELIGAVGLVPAGVPWGVFEHHRAAGEPYHELVSPEFGLFWAVFKAHQKKGYAAEAAQAVIDFVFKVIHARRIIATTEHENLASQGVMRKLGMTVEHNPGSDPFWFQVVGVLDNPAMG